MMFSWYERNRVFETGDCAEIVFFAALLPILPIEVNIFFYLSQNTCVNTISILNDEAFSVTCNVIAAIKLFCKPDDNSLPAIIICSHQLSTLLSCRSGQDRRRESTVSPHSPLSSAAASTYNTSILGIFSSQYIIE